MYALVCTHIFFKGTHSHLPCSKCYPDNHYDSPVKVFFFVWVCVWLVVGGYILPTKIFNLASLSSVKLCVTFAFSVSIQFSKSDWAKDNWWQIQIKAKLSVHCGCLVFSLIFICTDIWSPGGGTCAWTILFALWRDLTPLQGNFCFPPNESCVRVPHLSYTTMSISRPDSAPKTKSPVDKMHLLCFKIEFREKKNYKRLSPLVVFVRKGALKCEECDFKCMFLRYKMFSVRVLSQGFVTRWSAKLGWRDVRVTSSPCLYHLN